MVDFEVATQSYGVGHDVVLICLTDSLHRLVGALPVRYAAGRQLQNVLGAR